MVLCQLGNLRVLRTPTEAAGRTKTGDAYHCTHAVATNRFQFSDSKVANQMLRLTRFVARFLDTASRRFHRKYPEHLVTARRGEMEAYFYLRDQGYRIVAKNFRTPHSRGEIDLIGWYKGVLCFIEVKTHAHPGLVPPEMAVDAAKKLHVVSVARRYVQRLRGNKPRACRFDIVSVVLGDNDRDPTIRLYKEAFTWTTGRRAELKLHVPYDWKHSWRRR